MKRIGQSRFNAAGLAAFFTLAIFDFSFGVTVAHAEALPPHPTMVVYVANGEPDACGKIAAEGPIGEGSAARLCAVLNRAGKKLPVFFDSGGGIFDEALSMGRLLRERGLTAGVAKTIISACSTTQECLDLKRSGKTVLAKTWPEGGRCNSTCVYAFLGAATRLVSPDTTLGVHETRLAVMRKAGSLDAVDMKKATAQQKADFNRFDSTLRAFLREMGIDLRLADLAKSTPYNKLHFLTKEEFGEFGIARVADR